MREPILVVMAAGIGSRYGAGVKQLAKVGPKDEILFDYSLYDAAHAGFRKVVFIIRREIEADFQEVIGDRAERIMDVKYAFQDGDDLPEGFTKPADRTKPWGTGHAVLAVRELIDSPFAVINADDYYGVEAYRTMYDYLTQQQLDAARCGMVSFILKNTLSENGTVTRGVCLINGEGRLHGVHETKEICREADGFVRGTYAGSRIVIPEEIPVSMNMWGFSEQFLPVLQEGFTQFLSALDPEDLKSEYLVPVFVDELLKQGRMTVDVMTSSDRWFGITYQEDRQSVADQLKAYTDAGLYPSPLF